MFIFYQNILSIHQSAFIRSLAENYTVFLVVQNRNNKDREELGWNIPDFGKTKLIVNPSEDELKHLVNIKDAIHIFSGMNAYPMPVKALKLAVKNKIKVGIMSEPFNWLGLKGKIRILYYICLRIKYNKYIDFILAIGNKGRWCFEKIGFSKNKIFDWAYFTEISNIDYNKSKSDIPTFLFIGSIDKRKNIINLVDICLKLINDEFQLNIIGTGPLEDKMREKIENINKIHYLGVVPNIQITQYIENSDILILPSKFDGWGAVVNEALMCGIPVIASDNCGSSVLLDNKIRGFVFSVKKNDLQEVLVAVLKKLPYSIYEKQYIKDWAIKSISGEVAANYLVQICRYLYENGKKRPTAPWLKNK